MEGTPQTPRGLKPRLEQMMVSLFGQLEQRLTQLADNQAHQKEAYEA